MEPRRASEPFRPVATLGLVYFAVIFLALTLVLISPALWKIARSGAPPAETRARIEAAAREAARPKLPIAFVAALAVTAVGIRSGLLPGFRTRRR